MNEDGLARSAIATGDLPRLARGTAAIRSQGTAVRPDRHEGNHGEDVKEYTSLDLDADALVHANALQVSAAAFPYAELVDENRRRGRSAPEYELIDTGVFDADRYFDVFVEYAKVDAEDLLMRITVANRGPEAAAIRVLPTIWFRNTWAWSDRPHLGRLEARPSVQGTATIAAETRRYGRAGSTPTAIPRCCSPTTRPTPRGSPASRGRSTPRTASTTPSSTDAPTR